MSGGAGGPLPGSRISAIVPVWNGRDLLLKLIDTLEAQTRVIDELIAVDNGSSDGAPEAARQRGARIITMGHNAGFAAAVNRGIQESSGDWVAVLNCDVELAPDYLARLLAAAESEGAWFATGKILASGSKGRIDATYDAVCRGGTAWRVGSGREDVDLFAKQQQITSPPFTALLLRREIFRRVGLLETTFESYLEDVDFGLRCAAQDMSGIYVPGALAWHVGSAALGRWHSETVRRIGRNQLFLIARHYPRQMILHWLWAIVVAQILWGGVALRRGAGLGWLRGIVQGLLRFRAARKSYAPLPARKLEQLLLENERKIRDVQSVTGFDTYWKLYFLLTSGGAK